jgi:uncharacterized protein
VVVSLETVTAFNAAFGFYPDFDLGAADANAPDMIGQFSNTSGLTDTDEMVVLFHWDGVSPLVSDVDYVTYTSPSTGTDKTGVSVGGQSYQPDTPVPMQLPASGAGFSMQRCETAETSETLSGGNGILGHNETSENGAFAWKSAGAGQVSPKAAPPAGLCP